MGKPPKCRQCGRPMRLTDWRSVDVGVRGLRKLWVCHGKINGQRCPGWREDFEPDQGGMGRRR